MTLPSLHLPLPTRPSASIMAPTGRSEPVGVSDQDTEPAVTPGATAYCVHVAPLYPFERSVQEVVRGAGIRAWRILDDQRRLARGGRVTFEVAGTARQVQVFETLWKQKQDGIWGSIF